MSWKVVNAGGDKGRTGMRVGGGAEKRLEALSASDVILSCQMLPG